MKAALWFVALFGVAGTSQVMTLLPYLAQAKLPLISVYTGSPAVRAQQHPYLFTTRASYADEAEKLVQHLSTIGIQRIGKFRDDLRSKAKTDYKFSQ